MHTYTAFRWKSNRWENSRKIFEPLPTLQIIFNKPTWCLLHADSFEPHKLCQGLNDDGPVLPVLFVDSLYRSLLPVGPVDVVTYQNDKNTFDY